MTPRLLVIFGLVVFPITLSGEEPSTTQPRTMFAYLANGMHIGITNVDGTASVLISVYTSDDYTTALATSKLGQGHPIAKEAAKTNPAIKRELDAFMSNHGSGGTPIEHVRIMPPIRTTFGTLAAIGDDYVMIELDSNIKIEPNATPKRRRIIPKHSIGSIDLDAKPVRFFDDRP